MPDIGEMKFGTSESGLNAYIDAIRTEVLNVAGQQLISGLDDIDAVCDQHWEGAAKDKFKQNLRDDATHVQLQYTRLLSILKEEIKSLRAAMVQKDKTMFDK